MYYTDRLRVGVQVSLFFRRPPITPRDAPSRRLQLAAPIIIVYIRVHVRKSKPLVRISKSYRLGDLKNNIVNSAGRRIRITL